MPSTARTTTSCPHIDLQHLIKDNSQYFGEKLATRAWAQVFSDRHALSCIKNQPMGSEGRIHRIFAKSNFSRLSAIAGLEKPVSTWLDPDWVIQDKFYDRIRPALVLATRLLDKTGGFFDTVLWGKIEDRPHGRFYALEEGLTEGPSVFPEGHYWLKNLQIFTGHSDESDEMAWGTTEYGFYPSEGHRRLATQAIQLNSKFTTFFTNYHYEQFSDKLKQRLLFILAVTLVHELAHVWYTCRRFDYLRSGQYAVANYLKDEPLFTGNEPSPELGFSWEFFAFGCRFEPYFNDSDNGRSAYHLATEIACHPYRIFTEEERKGTFAARALTTEEIAAFLDEECWRLFKRLQPGGDLYSWYEDDLAGKNILDVMSMVVFIKEFNETSGYYPTPTEIAIPGPRKILHLREFPVQTNHRCCATVACTSVSEPSSDNESMEHVSDDDGSETDGSECSNDSNTTDISEASTAATDYSDDATLIDTALSEEFDKMTTDDNLSSASHSPPTFNDERPDYSAQWATCRQYAENSALYWAARGGRMATGRGDGDIWDDNYDGPLDERGNKVDMNVSKMERAPCADYYAGGEI